MNTYWRIVPGRLFTLSTMLVLCVACAGMGQPMHTQNIDDWTSKLSLIHELFVKNDLQAARKQADVLVSKMVSSTGSNPYLVRLVVPVEAALRELDHEPGLDQLADYVAEHFETIPLQEYSGDSLVSIAGLVKRAGRSDYLQAVVVRGEALIHKADINKRVLSLPQMDALDRVAQLGESEELHNQVATQRASIDTNNPEARLNLAPLEIWPL